MRNPWDDPTGVYVSGDDADGESVYSVLTPVEALSDTDESNANESGSHPSGVNSNEDSSIPVCGYCNENHHRRRLILCSDGAAYDFSNTPGQSSERLNLSSIYTISRVIEEGQVFDGLSEATVDQISMYIGGASIASAQAGASTESRSHDPESNLNWEQEDEIATERMLKKAVRNIYFAICKSLPCARDELFLFGEGTGASALVVAVKLLRFVGRFKIERLPGFESAFERAWGVCRDFLHPDQVIASDEPDNPFSQAPKVPFMGLIETKRIDHPLLNDVSTTIFGNVAHTYQALGLNHKGERATRLRVSENSSSSGSMVTEAWFFGNRLDLDGTSVKNGLSLWPLQWLVAEARGKGLVLDSESPSAAPTDRENASAPNLFDFLPLESPEYPFWFSNDVSVNIWNISQVFNAEYHRPEFQTSWTEVLSSRRRRTVFENDGTLCQYGSSVSPRKRTFIHPSVFYHMDQFSRDRNWDCYRKQIEDFRKAEVDANRSRFFWVTRKILPHKLRILVCGTEGVGKSSLINSVFNTDQAVVTMEQQTKHNIEEEVVVHKIDGEDSIIIHDSNGFETGDVAKNKEAERFIDKRCNQADQNEQLHCIWYCIKSDNRRKGDASVQKIFSKCFKEWKVPLVIVYTQSIRHEGSIESDIKAKHQKKYGRTARISEDNLIRERDKQIALDRSMQDKWIRETYKESVNEATLSDAELAGRSTSVYRIQWVDINDHQSLEELVRQTYDLLDPNLWHLFVKAQRVSLDLKAKESIRHGVRLIEGTPFFRVVTRHLDRSYQLKEMAKAILKIFAWDLPGEEVRKVVDYPGDKLFESGYFYTSVAATSTGSAAAGYTAAALIAEEVAVTFVVGAVGVFGAVLVGVGGVSYWALKRNQIRAWATFLCCFTVTSYRAMVKAMGRPIVVGQLYLTAEDFLNQKMTKKEVQELEEDINDFITLKRCFVLDYCELQEKIISLTERYITRPEGL